MQVCWAYESQMDVIAREMGWDPLEFRLKNLYHDGDTHATGTVIYSLGLDQSLRAVADAVNWQSKTPASADQLSPAGRPPLPLGEGGGEGAPSSALGPAKNLNPMSHTVRGKGIACSMKAMITPSIAACTLHVHSDGSVSVLSSAVDMGQGSDTQLSQIASETLGVRLHDISVVHPDTDVTPYDLITAGSRTTFHMGNAVRLAAADAQQQLFTTAAEMLDAAPEELVARDGKIWAKPSPDKTITFGQVMLARFEMRAGTITGHGIFETYHGPTDLQTGQSDNVTAHWLCGATAAEVEIDTETGQLRILNLATAVDVGKAINPFACRQQIGGASLQGTGPALFEEMLHDAGQLINASFADYKIPSFLDLPDTTTSIIVEEEHREGPYGAKGIGEAGIFAIAPAIANAIADALGGARVPDLPLTPEKILKAAREAGSVQS
jgi:CO/xanthine dehydrogenase Mo-binding subunit